NQPVSVALVEATTRLASGTARAPVAALASSVGHGLSATRLKIAALIVVAATAVSAFGYRLAAVGEPVHQDPQAVDTQPVAESRQPKTDQFGDPLPDGAIARLGTVRLRHGSVVHGLAFAPDGKTVASASNDGTARVWDVATGKELQRLEDTGFPGIGLGAMLGIDYSPDGKTLAIARINRPPCLWEIASGK